MTRHERLRRRERAVVGAGVVEARERGEPGVEGRDVVHDQQLERLDERAPGALAERGGAPLAVGHERGCEKRQLGAVDGEERLGHGRSRAARPPGTSPSAPSSAASTAGWASGASTAQTAAASARGPAAASPEASPASGPRPGSGSRTISHPQSGNGGSS